MTRTTTPPRRLPYRLRLGRALAAAVFRAVLPVLRRNQREGLADLRRAGGAPHSVDVVVGDGRDVKVQ
jgi:hypothetical protein